MAPRSHRFWCPVEQLGQRPHEGMNPNTTWSPGASQLDPVADLLDHAGTLVAADDRQLERQVAGHEVLVGVAHARGRQLDEHLAGTGRIELDLLDAPRRPDLPQDRCLRLHRIPLVATCEVRRRH